VGCINNDREFVGIDLSEDYTQIAKERCDIVSNLQMSAIV
jgi:DNA modification methylase